MARKDLGSLAALAGLAYMASRGKGNEETTPAAPTTPTAPTTPAVAQQAAPQIEDESDRGAMTPEQLAYDKQIATTVARPRAVPKPVAKPMGGSGRGGQGGATAEELAAYLANKAKPKYQSLQDRARAYEEERAKSGAGGMYGTTSKRREPLPTAEDMAYKKGGKVKAKKMASGGGVKGWGIARGSRKAKNY